MAVTFLHKHDKEAVVKKIDVLENNGIKVRLQHINSWGGNKQIKSLKYAILNCKRPETLN